MSEKKLPEFLKLNPPERERKYIYKDCVLIFNDVVEIAVSASGTHRLNLKDGTKAIVPTGWLAIKLDVDEWTF